MTEKYVLIKAIIKFQNIMFQVYFLTGGVYEKWLHFKMLTWKIAKRKLNSLQHATTHYYESITVMANDIESEVLWSSVMLSALNRKCIKCLCPEENKLSLGVLLRWLIKLERDKDHIYRMVKERYSNIWPANHCIWSIRTHYTFVSTNKQFAPNEDNLAMVQWPSTITILYIWSLHHITGVLYNANWVSDRFKMRSSSPCLS